MKKIGYPAVALLLTLVVSVGLAPWRAGATGEERPIRLYATAHTGPIGVAVGGGGEQMIWGGEMLRAPAGSSLRVSFDSVGHVTLARGAAARFAVAPGGADETGKRVLVASIIQGSIAVRLQSDAGAYVEAGGRAFTALQGANFRLGLEGGDPVLNTVSGVVHAAQQPAQRQYVLRPVGLGSSISVRARATRQIQIQVTDENDRPQTDVPIVFQLSGPAGTVGTLGATGLPTETVRTDSRGIATVVFTAGPAATAGQITATVEGTNFSWTGQISVTGGGGFWNVRNSVLTAAAVAAGLGAGLVITKNDNNNNGGLTPVPPPVVRP